MSRARQMHQWALGHFGIVGESWEHSPIRRPSKVRVGDEYDSLSFFSSFALFKVSDVLEYMLWLHTSRNFTVLFVLWSMHVWLSDLRPPAIHLSMSASKVWALMSPDPPAITQCCD